MTVSKTSDEQHASEPTGRVRATDRILADLKERIVSGAARRGSKLPTERELAARYSVSVPTVREAIRGLAAGGFVQVRHGSGTYVSADDNSLMATALGSVMRLRDVHARDALDLLNMFVEHAAAAAVVNADAEDLRRLREAAERCADRSDVDRSAAAARIFHRAVVEAAHNPLLLAISGYLVEVQTEFMREVALRNPVLWTEATAGIEPVRMRFVAAVEARRLKQAVAAARQFGKQAVDALELLEKNAWNAELPPFDDLMSEVVARIDR